MRSLFVAIGIALLGTACASSEPRGQYDGRSGDQRAQVFDAYLTDGSFVRVEQDRRSGDMTIVEPRSMTGEPVVMVNPDAGGGIPLVAVRSPTYDRREDRDRGDDRRRGDRDDRGHR
jgi:hypothetical protein